MTRPRVFDVVIVGGGIAGSCLAGLLARAGLGVVVLEKEAVFRDRIRGEGTWPWGVAEARRAGLGELFDQVGVIMGGVTRYADGVPAEVEWTAEAEQCDPGISFSHPQLQEAAFTWAEAQGATMVRPVKALEYSRNGWSRVSVAQGGEVVSYEARLAIGADGKHSMARRWTGGESLRDPEHHRMGGVAVTGAKIERSIDNYSWEDGEAVNWFAAGPELTRLYLIMQAERIRETGVDRSFDNVLAYANAHMPAGSLDRAEQAGPIGYFSCSDTWGSVLAGNGVVLIGDAAGSPDPCQGHGTPLLFHDVRLLSELLLDGRDWEAATAAFATERERVFATLRTYDHWQEAFFEQSDAAIRLRAGHERALQADPDLGGFSRIERIGPCGLVADEAMRAHFFGEAL